MPAAAALLAVGFLVAMALSGARRENQQLVQFRAAGLMLETPQEIDRVELTGGGRRLVFVRVTGGWMLGDRREALAAPTLERLEASLRFMHAAEPMRVLERTEWDATRPSEFGLDPPRYSVALSRGSRTALVAQFGATNPQQVAQYARIEGRDALYLMPRFVGREWESVVDAVSAR
jgi:hypothetical protein